MKIKIDPEFRDLIPPLSEVELKQLHDNISDNGCLTPLVSWKEEGILPDGHNRYAFCKKCDYAFQVTEIKLPHRDAAIDWIILNQLGRRNVSPDTAAKLRGMLDLLPKFKKAELQKLHDLLETDFGCHPAAASNEGRAS